MRFGLLLLALVMAVPGVDGAVYLKEHSKVDFPGGMGRMMRMFGGSAARDGVTTETWLLGKKMLSITDGKTGQLIDLEEEVIYEIDYKARKYRRLTFAEYKEQMEKAQEAFAGLGGGQQPERREPAKEMEMDVDMNWTGDTAVKAGRDARHGILTVTMRQKDMTVEEGGGMVMKQDMWVVDGEDLRKEISEFYLEFSEKIGLWSLGGQPSAQSGMLANLNPMLKDLREKFRDAATEVGGTPVSNVVTITAYQDPNAPQAQRQEQQRAEPAGTGLGGLGGRLGSRLGGFGRKKKQQQEQQSSQQKSDRGAGGPQDLMTTTSETHEISGDVPPEKVALPAGFKLRK